MYSFAVRNSHDEVFVTFGCNGDVQWADCLNGLSTEWLSAARPEEQLLRCKTVYTMSKFMTTITRTSRKQGPPQKQTYNLGTLFTISTTEKYNTIEVLQQYSTMVNHCYAI